MTRAYNSGFSATRTTRVGGPSGPVNNVTQEQWSRIYGNRDDIRLGNRKDPLPYSFDFVTNRGDRFGSGFWSNYWSNVAIAPTPSGNLAQFRASLYNATLSSVYEKVRGTLDLSVAVAQLAETKRMFFLADKLTELVSATSPRRLARLVSGNYLEFQYGWKPLVSDIYAAADTWMNRVDGIVSEISSRRAEHENAGILRSWNTSFFVFQPANRTFPTSYSAAYACKIKCFLDLSAVNRASLWTSFNPLSVAWELTPYSFVVDWFIDIGSYLRNYESHLLYTGLPVRKLSVSQYAELKFGVEPGLYRFGANYSQFVLGVSERHRRYVRTTPASLPKPLRPTFNVGLSSKRLLNSAALLTQLIRKD